MAKTDERMTKRETLPVVDENGRVLGSCAIRKFVRTAGKAYNVIVLYDTEERAVAEISGYRLHSRVRCDECAGNSKRIDSKDALTVARMALEHCGNAKHMLETIQEIAEILAEERGAKKRRRRSGE